MSAGFSLMELLVTIAVLAVVLTVAVPSFRDFLLNSRITNQTNEFVLALAYAKSEAVKRNLAVIVCSRATDLTCVASTTWDDGWLVYADTDANGAPDPGEILQVRADLEGGNTLRAGASQSVTFNSSGFSPGVNNDIFRLCDDRGTALARAIVVSPQGRVISGIGTAACP